MMRSGAKVTLDAQRFAQLGTWSGGLVVDGQDIAVDPETWIGTRDRSWGIRPVVGEPEPAGRPADPPSGRACGGSTCRWPSEHFAIVIIIQEEPNGFRTLNDCTRIWKDGRVEQLGWPRVRIHYRSGTRIPTGATIEATDGEGNPLALRGRVQLGVDYPRRRRLRRRLGLDARGVARRGSSPNGSATT